MAEFSTDPFDLVNKILKVLGKFFKALLCLLILEILLVFWFVLTCISKRAGAAIWSFMEKILEWFGFDS